MDAIDEEPLSSAICLVVFCPEYRPEVVLPAMRILPQEDRQSQPG